MGTPRTSLTAAHFSMVSAGSPATRTWNRAWRPSPARGGALSTRGPLQVVRLYVQNHRHGGVEAEEAVAVLAGLQNAELRVYGRHNVSNALAAASAASVLGLRGQAVEQGPSGRAL